MSFFYLTIVSILSFLFYLLFKENHKIKTEYRKEISNLNSIISDLLKLQNQQNGAVKLSDELLKKLHESRLKIDKNLLNLQHELIEKLIDNNLINS